MNVQGRLEAKSRDMAHTVFNCVAKRGHNFEEKIRRVFVPVKLFGAVQHLRVLTKRNQTVGYFSFKYDYEHF